MMRFALFVSLEAKPVKEPEVERLQRGGLSVVQDEPGTLAWVALRLGPSSYGIFVAFADEAGRDAHLAGRVAAALMAMSNELFAQPPSIERVDVFASKRPSG